MAVVDKKMSAKDDWLNGEPIESAWWTVLSPRQKQSYRRTHSDSSHLAQQRLAFLTICDLIVEGVVIATGKLVKSDGKPSNEIAYVGSKYFKNIELF
ncbi:hypothetical protein CCGE525_02510 [Rhizobium jaguaris]|uniref:Uncharacterized protein n=1 Tax=Rhizobium jaguaris TaxID=1312183 RepID=A0A387FKM8_9HYPH|nr:hypothetical protein CCGE525_02510 [Rhizobium jaguaris]